MTAKTKTHPIIETNISLNPNVHATIKEAKFVKGIYSIS